ncbi:MULTISPECIES: transglutaminase-like domain-containing protein [Cryobacterium]|uniref:transglutaminase-like domain-containing protein n=1 Tax=Cryobacterium TaxID=69578 RepID=UPI000CD46BB3|nr:MULTISPECIES: transglutaminase family protein [Cryobacterium]POH66770.1 transglutaminase [Cryobacterium zongtaii]TFC42431.1 transglutaminase family protein [Cryobacterium sp. TMN-39-2]
MKRSASAHLELHAFGPAELVLSVVVAADANATERLRIVQDGATLAYRESLDVHGTRLQLVSVQAGRIDIDYTVEVSGESEPAEVSDIDLVRYLRPSRYCESDHLWPTAQAEFRGLTGTALLDAITSWVGTHLNYVPGASLPTDGAVRTLLARQGVCRDYAHLVIAFLRAHDVPARLVSVYAPGLSPMDFHAVAEAFLDGAWQVVDATGLAPRQSLMRIATGRDAADTAFLSSAGAAVALNALTVTAVVDELPRDDVTRPARLA